MSDLPYTLDDFEVLYTADTIAQRVRELGEAISRDYADCDDLLVVSVLMGAQVFTSDLVRHIKCPLVMDVLRVGSYDGGTSSTGVVRFEFDLTQPIEGRDVLIVEDIVDTGLTMKYLRQTLSLRNPKSLRVCTFLHKPENNRSDIPLDYVGYKIPNRFVIGYGLDLGERYRNLPYIAALAAEQTDEGGNEQ